MNIPLQDGRREAYCLHMVSGQSGADSARLAGYCNANPQNARVMSWYLLKRPDVQIRLAQLREAAETKAVVTTTQIMERLSIIVRGKNDPNAIHASKELNLMRRIYREGVDVNIQQRVLNISVVSEHAREKLLKILDGHRTEGEQQTDNSNRGVAISQQTKTPLLEEGSNTKNSEVTDGQ